MGAGGIFFGKFGGISGTIGLIVLALMFGGILAFSTQAIIIVLLLFLIWVLK